MTAAAHLQCNAHATIYTVSNLAALGSMHYTVCMFDACSLYYVLTGRCLDRHCHGGLYVLYGK